MLVAHYVAAEQVYELSRGDPQNRPRLSTFAHRQLSRSSVTKIQYGLAYFTDVYRIMIQRLS